MKLLFLIQSDRVHYVFSCHLILCLGDIVSKTKTNKSLVVILNSDIESGIFVLFMNLIY